MTFSIRTKAGVTEPTGRIAATETSLWTALGLLRGVMSSQQRNLNAQNRMSILEVDDGDTATEEQDDPIHDIDYGYESDLAPAQVVDQAEWSEYQRRQLRGFLAA